jgi:hypothetical protein
LGGSRGRGGRDAGACRSGKHRDGALAQDAKIAGNPQNNDKECPYAFVSFNLALFDWEWIDGDVTWRNVITA